MADPGLCINCGDQFKKLNNRYNRLSLAARLPKTHVIVGDVAEKTWSVTYTPTSGKRKFVCLKCIKSLGQIHRQSQQPEHKWTKQFTIQQTPTCVKSPARKKIKIDRPSMTSTAVKTPHPAPTLPSPSLSKTPVQKPKKTKPKQRKKTKNKSQAAHTTLTQNPNNTQLARFYISTLKTVAKRLVLRIHPHMKRTICKRCDLLLIPGITATVRIRARREQHTVLTCLECKEVKRFLCREEYKLWVEQPESRQQPENYKKGKKKQGKNQQGKEKNPKRQKTTHQQQPSASGETKPATDT